MPTSVAPISHGSSENFARRYSEKKYDMKVTMPSDVPRGPKRRAYAAPKTTTTNRTSAITGCGDTSAAAVMASAVGSGSSAMVIRCRRGSGSLTERAETIVISAPSNATVNG